MQLDAPALLSLPDDTHRIVQFARFDADPRLFSCASFLCDTPGCECRDVVFDFDVVDDGGTPTRPEVHFRVAVVLATGREAPTRPEPIPADLEPLVAEVVRDLPPELREQWTQEQVAERAIRSSMAGARIPPRFLRSDDGVLLADFIDVPAVLDSFVHEGRTWEVSDQYCPRLQCPCDTTILSFAASESVYFAVRLARSGRLSEWECEGIDQVDAVAVVAAWAAIPRRTTRFFASRFDAVRKVSAATPPETLRAEPKIGRNDACPCGSGKKYKKCCGR